MTEEEIARYLRAHPEFFAAHGDLLSSISMPSAHGSRAISLHERQLEVLREKNRALEMKFAELIRNAQENDAIVAKIQQWARELLLVSDPERMPTEICDGLKATFAVPHAVLRVWTPRPPYRSLPCAAPVAADAITLANSMKQPYCGANADFQAATWLPEGGASARSIALMPLRKGPDQKAFGMLVLGSADPKRFQANMGTAFLERIADLAGAALSRLVE
jgi:uncharacterized protein YigA (DUF484 family)